MWNLRSNKKPASTRVSFRPGIEILEGRIVPAEVVWRGGTAGAANLWSVGANWVGGQTPGANDIAVFNGTSNADCTVDATVAPTTIDAIRINGYQGAK